MKKIAFFLWIVCFVLSCQTEKETIVKMKTSQGTMRLRLYPETPLHRDNFLKLVNEGYYDGMLFHRVISDFMIQTGDPRSKNARAGMRLGATGIGYTLKPEIRSQYFHKKGALAAARENDNVNPGRESSGSHFYIVKGNVFSEADLDTVVRMANNKRFAVLFGRLQEARQGEITKLQAVNDYEGLMRVNDELSAETRRRFKEVELVLTDEQRKIYMTIGGTPHLDGEYTVFGEVLEGLGVVDKIAGAAVDENFRPLKDVVIYKAEIER